MKPWERAKIALSGYLITDLSDNGRYDEALGEVSDAISAAELAVVDKLLSALMNVLLERLNEQNTEAS